MADTTACALPAGFRAAGVHCGIKNDSSKLDLALFVADGPATAVGVFTTNLVCGAPVKSRRARLPRHTARARDHQFGQRQRLHGQHAAMRTPAG